MTKVKNFRGIYSIEPTKMSREQLIAHLKHEYGVEVGEGPNEITHFATRAELLTRVHEEEAMAWTDYRDKLIAEGAPKKADGNISAGN